MAFNPFNLFKGNPKVIQLMSKKQQIEALLLEDAFPSQFKRSDNEALTSYMTFERYEQLIQYITVYNQSSLQDKNKSYKFPFVAAEILSINNQSTYRFLLEEVKFIQEEIIEEIQVQKSLDSQSSDRSYSSIKSNNSNASKRQKMENRQFQESDKENFILGTSNDKHLQDYDFSLDKEICEDDFPDARLKKTIMVKQTTIRTVKKPVQPLIFKVINYFKDNQVTHILDGYVCKVLENVLNNRFQTFINLIQNYQKFSYLKAIFSHIESTSVQQLLLNFINRLIDFGAETTISSEATLIDYIQDVCLQEVEQWHSVNMNLEDRAYYLHLYALVIQKLTLKMKEKQSDAKQSKRELNIYKQLKILSEIINNKHIQKVISILDQVIQLFQIDGQYSKTVFSYLKIMKSVLNCFLQLRQFRTSNALGKQQLITTKEIVLSCEDVFDRIISLGLAFTFQDFLFHDHQNHKKFKPKHSLGAKIEFLQIIAKLVQENIYFSKRTILDCQPFENILELLDVYPSSSMFHNCIMKTITPFFVTDIDVITLNKFFRKHKLLDFIYRTVKEDYLVRYENKKKSRKCYIGQIVSICLLIQKLNREESEQLLKYKQSEQWQYIHECLLQEEKGTRRQILGGLQKLSEKQSIIFFSKNDCLNHFKYFLSGQKFNLFDQFENYEPSNSDSEDQSHQKKLTLQKEQDKILQDTVDQSKYFDQNIDL